MACVFDPLLPGVCLHASCYTLFFRSYCSFFFVFNIKVFVKNIYIYRKELFPRAALG